MFQTAKLVRQALGPRDDGGEDIDRHARGGYRFVGPEEESGVEEPAVDLADAVGPYNTFVRGVTALESFNQYDVWQTARSV